MEGVKWLENIAKQLNPSVSAEAANCLNNISLQPGSDLWGRCCSRSHRAAAQERAMKAGIGMHPREHKPGVIAQAKIVGTSPLMQFQ